MKIYTGRGDFGNTNLIGGSTVKKTDIRVKAYGTIDELNSHVGLLSAVRLNGEHGTIPMLHRIQHQLFDLGTVLADVKGKMDITVTSDHITFLEETIDGINGSLPDLTHFILPGGGTSAAQAHVCRTVARRAERVMLRLKEEEPSAVDGNMMKYINRLSDFFFVLARRFNALDGYDEPVYDKTGEVFHND